MDPYSQTYPELRQAEADVWPQQHLPQYGVMPDGQLFQSAQ